MVSENSGIYREIFDAAGCGLLVLDENGALLMVNRYAAVLMDRQREDIEGKLRWTDLVEKDQHDLVKACWYTARTESGFGPAECDVTIKTPGGRNAEVLVAMSRLPQTGHMAAAILDITDRKQTGRELSRLNDELKRELKVYALMEENLRSRLEDFMAGAQTDDPDWNLHDPLTGLHSRSYFEEELRRLESGRYDPVGLIMCDVDGLKLVNDTFGHDAGDAVLMTASELIRNSFREGDVVSRVGGDEFAIVLPNSPAAVVEESCRRIERNVAEYNAANPDLPLSISSGFAIRTDGNRRMMDLFREADNQMYRRKLHSSRSARSAIVQTLMKALEARDYITEGHADRLQGIVAAVGMVLGLPERRISDLRLLAQFHDIGKVGIPDRILFKPARLTDEEYWEMRRHSDIGHKIAQSAPDLAPISDWILKHHEWWNGEGYPVGLAGENIPLECRILALADAYDAMTSDRPYRNAMTHEDAVCELNKYAGVQFDPDLVERFIRVVESIRVETDDVIDRKMRG
ncbi:MAG: diguanylate cyclase domain-containing protein [Solirubrobacterales bacterium]